MCVVSNGRLVDVTIGTSETWGHKLTEFTTANGKSGCCRPLPMSFKRITDGTDLRTVPATVDEEYVFEVASGREAVPVAPEYVNGLVHPRGPFETMEEYTRYIHAILDCEHLIR